jgi:Domain of unknown function (4846)
MHGLLLPASLFSVFCLSPPEPGSTVKSRFRPPDGYTRKSAPPHSFAAFLQNLPLQPAGSRVHYYNGIEKPNEVYEAVVQMDIGSKDLQQCADAVIRLRAEYLFREKAYDLIRFALTNGFELPYTKWQEGFRVIVKGNTCHLKKLAAPSNDHNSFRQYLDFIFTYAGTLSLSKSLHKKDISKIAIGDVFIVGGAPGHAIIVVDMAENKAGKKVFLLAQSYMPAQEIQVLKNFSGSAESPWYGASAQDKLITPEWTFLASQLKTW